MEEARAVEVVTVRVDTEEGGGEDDESLVLLRAGERVRVVSAQSPRPEASRSTLVFDLQIFPVNRTTLSVSGVNQGRNSPVSPGTQESLCLQEMVGDGDVALLPALALSLDDHQPRVRLALTSPPGPARASNQDGLNGELGRKEREINIELGETESVVTLFPGRQVIWTTSPRHPRSVLVVREFVKVSRGLFLTAALELHWVTNNTIRWSHMSACTERQLPGD